MTPTANDGKAIRNDDYKLIKFTNGTEKLFNLTLNPTETNNLLTGTMTAIDTTNYNYLCSQMATLVGSGISCPALATDSFFNNSNEIYVIENPFQSKISLNKVSNDDEFVLYSINGKKIFEGKNIDSKDFSFLSNGIYFVKISNQNKIFKVIKE